MRGKGACHMHANDVPLHGLTQDEVRARREAGRTNTMPRRADGGLADILRRNVMTLFNLLNLCLAVLQAVRFSSERKSVSYTHLTLPTNREV